LFIEINGTLLDIRQIFLVEKIEEYKHDAQTEYWFSVQFKNGRWLQVWADDTTDKAATEAQRNKLINLILKWTGMSMTTKL